MPEEAVISIEGIEHTCAIRKRQLVPWAQCRADPGEKLQQPHPCKRGLTARPFRCSCDSAHEHHLASLCSLQAFFGASLSYLRIPVLFEDPGDQRRGQASSAVMILQRGPTSSLALLCSRFVERFAGPRHRLERP